LHQNECYSIAELGILVDVLVYITQRDQSRYVAFQALQAAVYQLLNLIIHQRHVAGLGNLLWVEHDTLDKDDGSKS